MNKERNPAKKKPEPTITSELEGLVGMGMEKDALKLARQILETESIKASDFKCAVNAILILGDDVKSWRPLVESAFEHLSPREKRAATHVLIYVRGVCYDHEAVLKAMPKRMSTSDGGMSLHYVLEAMLHLGKIEESRPLAKWAVNVIDFSDNDMVRVLLMSSVAEFCARTGWWEKALDFWKKVREHETLHRNAVEGIVEIHCARALRAIERGFEYVERYKMKLDPELETMLPGNNKSVQKSAAKEFLRLQKILERIVPKERQKELGMGE